VVGKRRLGRQKRGKSAETPLRQEDEQRSNTKSRGAAKKSGLKGGQSRQENFKVQRANVVGGQENKINLMEEKTKELIKKQECKGFNFTDYKEVSGIP